MSFIKSLVKEIKTVKSMINIPDLKNERERFHRKIDELRTTVAEQQKVIQQEGRILQVTRDLEELIGICFEEKEKERAQEVINNLLNRVEEAEKISKSKEEEISRLEQELERVNEKLSAARAAVR
jgi:chromosome segregation ATPase